MKKEIQKVPTIRFKGFTDDWEQRKLRELFSSLQNNTFSRKELNDENGIAKNIHYGDVLIKYDECLDVSKEKFDYIDKTSVINKFKKSFLKNGDIVVADTAEDETVGKCTEIQGISNEKIISGLHTMPLRPVQKFGIGYLGFYMNSNSYHDQLKPLMQGIKVTSISKSAMADTIMKYPVNFNEQQKIGVYFQLLNTLITLHQRKLKQLQTLKKYFLQNMFPAKGEKVPAIRFKGFTDDWEQHKLGELTDNIDTGKSKFTFDSNGQYEILGSTSVIGYDGSYDYEGNFLLTARVGVNAGNLYRHAGKVKISDNTVFFQGKYIDFLYYLLEKFDLKRLSFGTGQPLVKASELRSLELYVPTTDTEKNRIGVYFKHFDDIITLQQRKLDQLQSLKKFMLQNLFI